MRPSTVYKRSSLAAAASTLLLSVAGCEAPAPPDGRQPAPAAASAPSPATASTGPTRTGVAQVNGARLYYQVWGDLRSGRTPLLIMHGSQMSSEGMVPFARAFAPTRPVIAFDAREHGRNGDLPTAITYPQLADDAAGLLSELGVQRADVFGWSMGAITAVEMAVRHPDRVSHLVPMSGPYNRVGWRPDVLAGIAATRAEFFEGTGLLAEYRRLSPTPAAFPRLVEDLRQMEIRPYGASEAAIRALPHPTMIIVGDADGMILEHALAFFRLRGGENAQAATQGYLSAPPRARLAILPGTSHIGLGAQPELIASLVAPFLDDRTPPLPANFLAPGDAPPPPPPAPSTERRSS